MLSDITLKGAAMLQLSMYENFNHYFGEGSALIGIPAAVVLSLTDTGVDTLKYPMAAIENASFAVINALGAYFVDECRLLDARHNLQRAALAAFIATPVMLVVAVPKGIMHLCKTVEDFRNAKTTNGSAEGDAKIEWVVTDESKCRELRGAKSFNPSVHV